MKKNLGTGSPKVGREGGGSLRLVNAIGFQKSKAVAEKKGASKERIVVGAYGAQQKKSDDPSGKDPSKICKEWPLGSDKKPTRTGGNRRL